MATLTIRGLDESLTRNPRVRAASRNRSMEEEARQTLRIALLEAPAPSVDLATRIRSRFVGLGDVQPNLPGRERVRQAPNFAEGAKHRAPTKRRK
jgi:antitoxin FitA